MAKKPTHPDIPRLFTNQQVMDLLGFKPTAFYEYIAHDGDLRRARKKLKNGSVRWYAPLVLDWMKSLPSE